LIHICGAARKFSLRHSDVVSAKFYSSSVLKQHVISLFTLNPDESVKSMEAFYIFIGIILWIAPVAWAWKSKHELRLLILVLCLCLGGIGYLVSLIIISHKNAPPLTIDEEGVYACSNCGMLYRLADYRQDAVIVCRGCSQQIIRPILSNNAMNFTTLNPKVTSSRIIRGFSQII
jgi:hypothetical protein